MNKQKITDIEALRGLALLLILCYHYFVRFAQLFGQQVASSVSVLQVEHWSTLGVGCFLLISGYFMVPSAPITRRNYLIKRLLRLWPAYLLAICVIFLVTHIWSFPLTVTFQQFLLNIPFVNGFIGTPYVDGAHWYLTALLSGIFVFSFIIKLPARNRYYAYGGWLLALLVLFLVDSPNRYLHFCKSGLYILLGKNSAPVLIMGACLADIHKNQRYKLGPITLAAALAVKFILENSSFAKLILVCFALVLVILALKQCCFLFKSKALIWLGTVSYPVYLIHQFIGYDLMYHLMKFYGHYAAWMALSALVLGLILGILLFCLDSHIQNKIRNLQVFGNGAISK